MVSSSKTADNFVFLKVIYFITIVNLKNEQLLKIFVKDNIRCIISALNIRYLNGLMVFLHGQEKCSKIERLSRHQIQLGSPFVVYTLVLNLH